MQINATWSEIFQWAIVGTMREVQCLQKGMKNRHNIDEDISFGSQVEGAVFEGAVAKARNTYWNGALGDFKAPDVGDLQVRGTRYPGGFLLLHPDDKDKGIFILITGTPPTFNLRGWITGADGCNEEYWEERKKGRPCFWVPQDKLQPMSALEGFNNG